MSWLGIRIYRHFPSRQFHTQLAEFRTKGFAFIQDLKLNLIPRDVVIRWNSTFHMLIFGIKYREVIDMVTADKNLKLRAYEQGMVDH